jgi:hypothetical protein
MHSLPFGARLTDSLVDTLRDAAAQCVPKNPDFMPCLSWCTQLRDSERFEHWVINAFSRSYMRDQDMFTVDGVTFCIAPGDQVRAAGGILDWQRTIGVVQLDTPNET